MMSLSQCDRSALPVALACATTTAVGIYLSHKTNEYKELYDSCFKMANDTLVANPPNYLIHESEVWRKHEISKLAHQECKNLSDMQFEWAVSLYFFNLAAAVALVAGMCLICCNREKRKRDLHYHMA
jgi:hypothetical protein